MDTLDLYPMGFGEFLAASGNAGLAELVTSDDPAMIDSFSGKLVPLLRQYYYVGGMPEAVSAFLKRGMLEDAREVQEQILLGYERDISKHLTRTEAEYAIAAWRSIPQHLGRENLRAKSLRAFKDKHPDVVALRFSMSGFREQGWMRNVPLYAMSNAKLWGFADEAGQT